MAESEGHFRPKPKVSRKLAVRFRPKPKLCPKLWGSAVTVTETETQKIS